MDIYINGSMQSPDQAFINAADAGLMHGVGLFETMAAQNGRIFRRKEHLERMSKSASALGLAANLDTNSLAKALTKTIEHNHITEARIRLTITPGALSLLTAKQGPAPKQTIIVSPSEPTIYDPAYFEKGITVSIAGPGANPFDPMAGHKTLNYWPRLRALRQAAAKGAGEALWLNVSNHLASGCVSNVFLVKEGQLLTPIARGEEVKDALPAPVLPGITRAAVLEIAGTMEIKVNKKMLSIDDLLEADEVFLTNSSWQVLPVTRVEKSQIGSGRVGPLTAQLRQKLLAIIEQETSA